MFFAAPEATNTIREMMMKTFMILHFNENIEKNSHLIS